MPTPARLDASASVVTALAPLSDGQFAERLPRLAEGHHGWGSRTGTLDVGGVPVFVKELPLTAVELEHPRSTANRFGLPACYQYGIGSAGFGAWRELAAHEVAASWVAAGRSPAFPLLHHWRLLPRGRTRPDVAEQERQVAEWGGSEAVRRRLAALAEAPARRVLALEHWPTTLHAWLRERIAADGGADAIAQAEEQLEAVVAFLAGSGMRHFDLHFDNVLTDGGQLVVGDLGLAAHDRFDLDEQETAFHARHRASPADLGYDRASARAHLVRWLVAEFLGRRREAADAVIVHAAAGRDVGLPPAAAGVVARHAPVATVMQRFWRQLWAERATPYPVESLRDLFPPG